MRRLKGAALAVPKGLAVAAAIALIMLAFAVLVWVLLAEVGALFH